MTHFLLLVEIQLSWEKEQVADSPDLFPVMRTFLTLSKWRI